MQSGIKAKQCNIVFHGVLVWRKWQFCYCGGFIHHTLHSVNVSAAVISISRELPAGCSLRNSHYISPVWWWESRSVVTSDVYYFSLLVHELLTLILNLLICFYIFVPFVLSYLRAGQLWSCLALMPKLFGSMCNPQCTCRLEKPLWASSKL